MTIPLEKRKAIDQFKGEYEFLSNSYPSKINYEGITYLNAEAAFQAQKCRDPKSKLKFARLSASKARAKANQLDIVDNWEEIQEEIMAKVLKAKFNANNEDGMELVEKLIATDGLLLINNNTYMDEYWGIYNGNGKNMLGVLLMELREELIELLS